VRTVSLTTSTLGLGVEYGVCVGESAYRILILAVVHRIPMTDSYDPYPTMEVHDEFVPEDPYREFVSRMPQVCVDLVLETDAGILLAKRPIALPGRN
jgi:hypothetical protein